MEPSSDLFDLATIYYSCRDTDTLLKTFASRLAASFEARAVLVWLREKEIQENLNAESEESEEENDEAAGDGLSCRTAWVAPGERFDVLDDVAGESLLRAVLADGETRQFTFTSGDDKFESLIHLSENSRLRVKTALYVALPGPQGAIGVVEVLNPRRSKFVPEEITFTEEASRITALALENRFAHEREQHGQLSAIERLTSLYDISRIFNSTLELEELLPVIAEKVRDILNAEAANLWLVDPAAGDLFAVQQAGEDPTVGENARCAMGEGLLGQTAQSGKAALIADASEEELLVERNEKSTGEFKIETMMISPMLKGDEVLGILEVINRLEGGPFSEEDLFFLTSVSEQAAIAIHNAKLLEAERKVSVLDALLSISREITSTLDLDHVLTTVVHQASTVVPFDKCVIGLFDRDRFLLGAVSGEKEVPKTREMDRLRSIIEWVSGQEGPVAADQYEDGWRTEPEEFGLRGQVSGFLEEHGYSGFYVLPLRDDQGALGAIALLSGDAEFLNDSQKETLAILANQVAVAIRNAQLYQQVPLSGFLKPLAERKEKVLGKLRGGRWIEWAGRAAVIVGLLIAIPYPVRIGANVTVVPAARRIITAEASGIVQRVLVREGIHVKTSQLVGVLDSSANRVKLAQAETSLALAERNLAEAEFRRDPAAAGQARFRVNLYRAETTYERTRVDEAQLISPISGVVVTPHVEQKVGTLLHAGEEFCEVVDEHHMAVKMYVRETDLPLLRTGAPVDLKLNALPTMTIVGKVDRIGAIARPQEGEQFFVVRASFTNPGDAARDGMVGRAKILASGGWFSSGWYPVGYALFRAPFRWAWEKTWSWLP